jgi:hypothetical protein
VKRADGGPRWILVAAALLPVGFAWRDVLRLPLSGEDWGVLARLRLGEAGSPHVFRPWSDAWLAAIHGLAGPSATALHGGSLLLHLANTALVALVALELLASRLGALAVALLFGLGAGVLDSLAWVAAVNRPLASTGALLALLGLVRLERRARAWLALLVGGLLLELGANEEVYGTALLALAWLVARALAARRLERGPAVGAALALVFLLVHYFALNRIALPAGKLRLEPAQVASGVARRAAQVAGGLSLPAWAGLLFPGLSLAVLLAARRGRLAAIGAGAWVAALIPFALSEPAPYRAYPSQAPTALLAGAALEALLSRRLRGSATRLAAGSALTIAIFALSEPARRARLVRWQAALAEVHVVERDARALARELDEPPVLVNLEPSSVGPFCYAFGVLDPTALRLRGFLDVASAYEEPGDRPPGVWYGRRFEGSYGRIDPERYFAGRPRVEPIRTYERALPVGSLDEAERVLRDPALDLTTTAVVEARAAELAAFLGPPPAEPGPPAAIEVVAPFEFGSNYARMSVRLRVERPALLVYQEHWLHEYLSRLSADQVLRSDQADLRRVALAAREQATGASLPVLRANAFGFAVPLAPGGHELELAWSVRRDE